VQSKRSLYDLSPAEVVPSTFRHSTDVIKSGVWAVRATRAIT
jgi:hypothetical protein